jgi:hypothetical protein
VSEIVTLVPAIVTLDGKTPCADVLGSIIVHDVIVYRTHPVIVYRTHPAAQLKTGSHKGPKRTHHPSICSRFISKDLAHKKGKNQDMCMLISCCRTHDRTSPDIPTIVVQLLLYYIVCSTAAKQGKRLNQHTLQSLPQVVHDTRLTSTTRPLSRA